MHYKEEEKEFYLCRVSYQIKIHPFVQTTVMVRCHRDDLLVEAYPNVVKLRFAINGKGTMDILQAAILYLHYRHIYKRQLITKTYDSRLSN